VGDALAKLLADGKLRRALGEAGRARALRLFTQDRMHQAWSTVYADATRGPAPA
jgi:glycosyltransferase involved in cell wall biosynthesis